MRVSVMRSKRNRVECPLVLICLGVFIAFPIATKTSGNPQEANDAAAYNAKGLQLSQSSKFEEAVTSFKQAIKLKQDYAEAHYNLGDVYFQIGQYKKAVEAYKQAIRYQPDSATAYNNMGTAYYKLGEHKKAIEAYKAAIRLKAKDAITYYNLAGTYIEHGNQEAALEQYKILKTIDPPLAEKLYILIYKPMATVFDSDGVRLSVIARDSQGAPVSDLSREDFQLFEEGLPQTISSFSKGRIPLVYALTIDASGSIRPAFDLVIEACKSIVQNNLPDDETLLVRFISSDKIEALQEFTSDQKVLTDGLETLYIEIGQSAILDAVYLSAQRVAQYKFAHSPLRRAIILITDGDDRASYYSMGDLRKLLRKIDVRLFAISLSKADKKGAKLNQNQPQRWVDLLMKLASETGGQAYFPKSDTELRAVIKQMTSLIRAEYIIGYKPASSVGAGTGTYRRVSVNIVTKPGREQWSALTREGYVVSEK
jgi:Ca-activated chloride channel family protein